MNFAAGDGFFAEGGSRDKSNKEYGEFMSSNLIKNSSAEKRPYRGLEVLAGIYTLVMLCIFPFVVHDRYFDILPTKYLFYSTVTSAVLVFTVIYLIASGAVVRAVRSLGDGSWRRHLSFVDWAAVAFVVLITISTIQSEFRFESFWGNEGRYTGLFTLLLYVFSYFFVSRLLRWKQWYLDLFLAGGILACLWGITDYFRMDIFHFKERIASDADSFTSSFGNINTYTIYVAMVIAAAAILFLMTESVWRSIFYYICFVIGMFALIMGESDNAYLSLGTLFALAPLYTFRKSQAVRRYVVLTATILTVAQFIEWINVRYADTVIGINSLFSFISGYDKIMTVIAAVWILAAVLYLLKLVIKKESPGMLRVLRIAWGIVLAGAVLFICYMFYDANFAGHQEKYQAIAKYLVFNDSWGTNRGFAWRISWQNFQNFPLHHKIFGFGPDTFGIITTFNNYQEMSETYHVVFDNAHNEYLQFLLTIGIAGLAGYLAFLISAFVKMTREAKGNALVLAPMFAFVCYSAQAVVNLNVPITAPFMWLFLAMGLAACWHPESEENKAEVQKADAKSEKQVSAEKSGEKMISRAVTGELPAGRRAPDNKKEPGSVKVPERTKGSESAKTPESAEMPDSTKVPEFQADWAVDETEKRDEK